MDTQMMMMQMRTGLVVVRSFQVALAVAACVVNLMILAHNGQMYDHAMNLPMGGLKLGESYNFIGAFGAEAVHEYAVQEVEQRVAGMLAGSIIEVAVNLLTLILTIALLVLTTRPKSRARASCCGNQASCAHFHADMGIDIMFAVFYFILFILSLTFSTSMFAVAYTAVFVALFIVSAVFSGEIRRTMHHAAEARTQLQSKPSSIVNQRMSFVDRLEPDQDKWVELLPAEGDFPPV